MVVTASRLHALKYKRALDKYCAEHGIGDVGVLAAFSGSLDDDGEEWTETKVNGFPDSETPARFDIDDWQILFVAEKCQTSFDQPKLYAMCVDKTLTGLATVQTLSRLNRTHKDKTCTFVLDSRNTHEQIQESFEPWYVRTHAPPTDPHPLYDTHAELGPFDVLRTDDGRPAARRPGEAPPADHVDDGPGCRPVRDPHRGAVGRVSRPAHPLHTDLQLPLTWCRSPMSSSSATTSSAGASPRR